MFDAKRGIGGLLVALSAVAIVVTASSQAEVGAKWRVKGTSVNGVLLPLLAVKEIEKAPGTEEKYVGFLSQVGEVKTEFRCSGMSALGAKLEPEGKVGSETKFRFTGCILRVKGAVIAVCEPLNKGTEKGVIVTSALKGLLVLHEGKGLIRFEPVTGKSFAFVEFSEECAIFPGWGLGGKLTLKDQALGTEAVSHLFSEGPLSELTLEGEPTTFCGSIVLELAGEHKAIQWSGVPG